MAGPSNGMPTTHPMQKGRLSLLTLAHFCIDSYASFLPPLLPLVVLRMDLSLTLAGLLASIAWLTSSLVQPLAGILADRSRKHYLLILGLLLAALFIPAIGLVSSYGLLAVVLFFGSIGVSCFHPQSVSMAGDMSGNKRGLGVSLFLSGGTMGLALSPLWVTYYVSLFKLEALVWTAIPGLLMMALMYRYISLDKPHWDSHGQVGLVRAFRPQWKTMTLLISIVIIRSIASMGFAIFLPLLMKERGASLVQGGAVLSLYSTAGVLGGLIGGYLSDRLGRRPVILLSILGSIPLFYGFLFTDGMTGYIFLGLAGLMIMASNAVIVAMAQELVPANAGLASSLPMGFGWGVAGLTLPLVGNFADRLGVAGAMHLLALVPLAAAALASMLPRQKAPAPAYAVQA